MEDDKKKIHSKGDQYFLGGMKVFLDSFGGKDSGQAIMDQEKREQQRMVSAQRLPKKFSFPEYYPCPIEQFYKKLGIKIIEEYDDLFYKVELPKGWKIEATEHSMGSNLLDDVGRLRAKIFYKGAFYDRKADISFRQRYTFKVVPEDEYEKDLSCVERHNNNYYGVVYDAGMEVFRTVAMRVKTELRENDTDRENVKKHYEEKEEIDKELRSQCISFLEENYPEYKDIFAYWDGKFDTPRNPRGLLCE